MQAVIKFLLLQGKASKEIHVILTETLACFLPGRAKDLSAPLYLLTLTYLLTLCSGFLLEKLTGSRLVKKLAEFYATRRFIATFLPATCPYPEPNRTSPCPHIPLPEYPSWPIQTPNIPSTKFHVSFPLLRSYQRISPGPRPFWMISNMIHFYGEEILVLRPNPKLEGHSLSAVRDCLFNIFAATLHIGGRSSIRNLRMRNAVVTGTQYHAGTSHIAYQLHIPDRFLLSKFSYEQ